MWRISQTWPRDRRAGCALSAVIYLAAIALVILLLYRVSSVGATGWAWLDENLPPTVSVIEFMWTATMTGFLLRVLGKVPRPWYALREYQRYQIDGPLLLTAHSRVVRLLGSVLGFEFWAALGVLSMLIPREPETPLQQFAGFVALVFIFFGAAMFAFVEEATCRYEREVLRYYQRHQAPAMREHLELLEPLPPAEPRG